MVQELLLVLYGIKTKLLIKMNTKIVIVCEIILLTVLLSYMSGFATLANSIDDYKILLSKLYFTFPFAIFLVILERFFLKRGFEKK